MNNNYNNGNMYQGYGNDMYPNQGYNNNMNNQMPNNYVPNGNYDVVYNDDYNNGFTTNNMNSKPPKKKKKWILLLLLLLLLIVAAIFIYLNVIKKDNPPNPDDGYEEYDPNYGIEESNSNSNITSNSNIISNSNSNIVIDNTIPSNSNSNVSNSNVSTSNSNQNIAVTGVKLNKTSLSLTKGSSSTLKATVTPNNATNKGVTWKSSNTSVATVSSSGKVTAKGAGTATITVTTKDGSKKATCKVTVPVVAITGITINSSTTVEERESITASITYKPTNADNKGVTWTSSNTNVATVSSSGKITGVKTGTATITAKTKNGKTATKTIKVIPNSDDYVVVLQKVYMGIKGYWLNGLVLYQKSQTTDYKNIIYNGTTYNSPSAIGMNNINTSVTTMTIVLTDGTQIKNVKIQYDGF